MRDALIKEVVNQSLPYEIKWPNATFEAPNAEPWLRVNILTNQPSQISLGSNGLDRVTGFMQIDIFTPKQTGDTTAIDIADEITTALKSGDTLTSNGLELRVESVGGRQGQEDSVWYHYLLRVEFNTSYKRL
ncbi:MAG: phage tail terminator-like protein [Psychrobium sp.]